MLSVAPALECDLEPFHKLRRFILNPSVSSTLLPLSYLPPGLIVIMKLHVAQSRPPAVAPQRQQRVSIDYDVDYPLSSNPPNPRTSFRLGDWM
jgi:hypothetical protein